MFVCLFICRSALTAELAEEETREADEAEAAIDALPEAERDLLRRPPSTQTPQKKTKTNKGAGTATGTPSPDRGLVALIRARNVNRGKQAASFLEQMEAKYSAMEAEMTNKNTRKSSYRNQNQPKNGKKRAGAMVDSDNDNHSEEEDVSTSTPMVTEEMDDATFASIQARLVKESQEQQRDKKNGKKTTSKLSHSNKKTPTPTRTSPRKKNKTTR